MGTRQDLFNEKSIKPLIKKVQNVIKENKEENCQYFKLPYIGNISEKSKHRLDEIVSKFCKTTTSVKIAFISQKISSYFSLKDKKLEKL